jgi:hypothetical protein
MDKKQVSNWIRQSRYRAKKQGIQCDISIEEVLDILNNYDGRCAYCDSIATSLDHPFPLKDEAPNVSANVLPICKSCKNNKKINNIMVMYNSGILSEEVYVRIMKNILDGDKSGTLKKYVKRLSGRGSKE